MRVTMTIQNKNVNICSNSKIKNAKYALSCGYLSEIKGMYHTFKQKTYPQSTEKSLDCNANLYNSRELRVSHVHNVQ